MAMVQWIPPADPDPLELIGRDHFRPWPGVPRTAPGVVDPGVRYLGPGEVVRSLAREGAEPEGLRPRPSDRVLVVEEPLVPEHDVPTVREPLYLSVDRALLWSARPVVGTGWELSVSDFRHGVGTERSTVVAAPTRVELDELLAGWGWTPVPGRVPRRTEGAGESRLWLVVTYIVEGEPGREVDWR